MTDISQDLVTLFWYQNSARLREAVISTVQSSGWNETREKLREAARGSGWYYTNRTVLSLFDLEELIGYDGDVLDVLDSIDDTKDPVNLSNAVQKAMIDKVRQQVQNGGSTLFLDTARMETRPTGTLISDIAEARRSELESALSSIANGGGFVDGTLTDLSPLILTAYGFSLIRSLPLVSFLANDQDLKNHVLPALTELEEDMTFKVPEYPQDPPDGSYDWYPRVSQRLADLARAAMRFYMSQIGPEDAEVLLSSGFISCKEVVKHVTSPTSKKPSSPLIEEIEEESQFYMLYPSAVKALVESRLPQRTDLLVRVLQTFFDVSEYEYFHPIHELVLKALSEDESEPATRAIIHFIDSIYWEDSERSDIVLHYLSGTTSFHALELALDIALERGLSILDKLEYLVTGLPQLQKDPRV